MRIATWNVNGIRARLGPVTDWLRDRAPDIALLQEIKTQDDGFPREAIAALGYEIHTHGQKGFNGVAILSRLPVSDVMRGLPGDEADGQARWIEATVTGTRPVRVACLYLPNGNPAPGPKYDYKLAWMERLRARARAILASERPAVLAGDYNVIPTPQDARRPEAWAQDALFLPDSRAAFRRLEHLGLYDAIRLRHPDGGHYTFWDFQRGAWERDDGIRIDHHLLTPQAADLLTDAWVEREMRGGERPSDHVPVWVQLDA
ncbi:Exodeoxyribonuclease III [Rubellimicrobium thermophilum DSM 16684]|uniref:Exodeoxyribonuclease III n=1 Tax=Rubellimicrobium thermophilum DSM 16684 TaxID=1123069 RepID=S9QWX6_9RHOB|nr:exodeoxyribonuclease III [Rubellimicrobium thermophilum]EPX85911.1 Exodeoxyribonuclease III [Rubellimicrobium thermophilum DSM 16684]